MANKPEQQIIEAVYAERAKVDTWSKSSRQQVKDSVLARFDHELVGP